MNHITQKVYKFKKVKGPGNYNDDYYSIHVTGVSVCNNEICFEDNKRIATRLFFVDVIARRVLRNFFRPGTRLRRDIVDSLGYYIGNNILKKANLEGSISSSMCGIHIVKALDDMSYVCERPEVI
jgi:hypothetical protein